MGMGVGGGGGAVRPAAAAAGAREGGPGGRGPRVRRAVGPLQPGHRPPPRGGDWEASDRLTPGSLQHGVPRNRLKLSFGPTPGVGNLAFPHRGDECTSFHKY